MKCQHYNRVSSTGMMYRPNTSKRKRIRRCRIIDFYRASTAAAVLIGICCCIKRISSFSIQHHPSRWIADRKRCRTSPLHQSSKGASSDYNSQKRYNRVRGRTPRMSEMRSLEELTQMAYEHKDRISPRDVSAFWSSVPQLLRKSRFEKVQNVEQMNHQLDDILGHTLEKIDSFDSRDLATVAISLAKTVKNVSGTDGKRLPRFGTSQRVLFDLIIGDNSSNKGHIFKILAATSINILYKFDTRSLSNLIYAYGLAQVVLVEDGITLFDVFAQAAIPNLSEFNGQGLSNILWAYANVEVSNSKLFEQAGDSIVAMNNLNEFWPQALSNILWAYATLDEQHPKLFKRLADHIVQLDNLKEFWPQALSNTVWAYATLDEPHPKLYKKIGDHIIALDNLNEFWPQALSNIVWAFTTAGETHPMLFERVAGHIVGLDNLKSFKPQDLSNIVWSYATAGEQDTQLFKKVADHIVLLDLVKFWPQALSNILWAFATSEESHPQLFKKVADHIVQLDNLDKFNPQALSNTVWAYATLDEQYSQLFKKVSDHIIELKSLHDFKPQALSNTVWAFATAEERHPRLFKRLADHIATLDNLDEFKLQALSNTVWAYATAGESQPQLFNKLAEEAIKRQREFNPQEIANFLWALATNGQVDKHLFSSLVPSVKENLDKCNEQELINVAWAYSVANVDAPSVFNNDDFINACQQKEDEFELEALRQLHQWQLWQEEIESYIDLPSSLQKRCYEAFVSEDPTPSKLQDDVISILSSMGLQPQEEVLLKSGYRIDAVVEVNGEQIAVEVDGPSHFIGRELTGSTILKHRQVTALDGIQVVSIPYWEWIKLKIDSGKKKQYLQDLLGT